jgi:hypothetical protein
MSKSLSGINIISDNAGTIISGGVVNTNEVITKSITDTGNIYMDGGIFNGSNSITFNEPYQFVDIQHNLHVYGTMLLDYQGSTLNVGQLLAAGGGGGGGSTAYPSITYDSATGVTTFTGALVFPSQSILSNAIINSDFITLGTTQNVSGSKTYSTQQTFSNNIRLDGSLLLNSAGLVLNNSNLQKIQWLSNVSSDIAASISSLSTKLTAISYAAGSPNITTIADKLQGSVISFSNTLNGVSSTTFGYISTLSSNAENRLVSNANDIQVLKDCTRNLTATSSASTFANTLNTSTLNASTFVFSNTINNISVLDFSNVMMYCKSLTSDCQNQISAAAGVAASGLALATTASAGVAGIVTTTLPAMSALITANTNGIAANTDAIGTLQQKTTGLSYSNATTISTIGLLNATTIRIGNLESGFTQITNSPIVIIGTCEHRNGLSVTNGFGLSVDGGIVQNNNSANTFNGSVSCIRDFTTSGTNSNLNSTNIQIGTSSAAALTVNATSTFASDATFAATKKLVIKNIVPRNLDDIYFGGEAGAYVLYNTIFNTKTAFNEPVSVLANYKQGTTALRYTSESFNSTYSVTANTSVTLSAPLVSIGNLLSATTIYGNLVVVGSISNSTGILSTIGQVVQQF